MLTTATHHQTAPSPDTDLSKEGEQISTPMVAALEQAWADIRHRHPEVPAAVIVLGAGSIGAPRSGMRLGHFAAMRWHEALYTSKRELKNPL